MFFFNTLSRGMFRNFKSRVKFVFIGLAAFDDKSSLTAAYSAGTVSPFIIFIVSYSTNTTPKKSSFDISTEKCYRSYSDR